MGNVKQNFKRSCLNLGMVIAIVVPLGIFFVSLYDGGILGRNVDMDLLSAYATPMALSNYVQFACLFPILPFAFSFCEDKNSGYLQYIRLRLSEKSYIQEKMFWTGVSGGIAATIPSMILFLVLICCYHPASNMPDSMYYPSHLQGMMWEKYIGVWGGILILLLKLILVFLFGVFCSEAALLISVICANRYVVFVGILTFYLVNWILTPGKYSVFVELFLLRGDFFDTVPLWCPYLIQIIYISIICILIDRVYRRKMYYEQQ